MCIWRHVRFFMFDARFLNLPGLLKIPLDRFLAAFCIVIVRASSAAAIVPVPSHLHPICSSFSSQWPCKRRTPTRNKKSSSRPQWADSAPWQVTPKHIKTWLDQKRSVRIAKDQRLLDTSWKVMCSRYKKHLKWQRQDVEEQVLPALCKWVHFDCHHLSLQGAPWLTGFVKRFSGENSSAQNSFSTFHNCTQHHAATVAGMAASASAVLKNAITHADFHRCCAKCRGHF